MTASAFFAVLLPVDWMASAHHALMPGAFPRAPIVDYLTRSIALLYGFHGVLMIIVAADPVRYRPIVSYIAAMDILFGFAICAIDIHAGMPWFWTVGETTPITGQGIIIALLNTDPGRALKGAESFSTRRRLATSKAVDEG